MKQISILILLFSFSSIQCSSKLHTKQDYYSSTYYLNQGKINAAIKNLPTREKNSFIPTMEKTYLNLLSGKPDIDDLIAFAEKIKHRVRYKVSREIKAFFYVETPEGYYASEHEIIWMHMLLSWGYSLRGEYEKAAVEAKISANLLKMEWSEKGQFNDPLLRIILAGLWAQCGHWEEAQVDFRAAAKLDPSLAWARKLGNMEKPPASLVLILGGTGPEPVWNPTLSTNLFRGFRGITFKRRGLKSKLILKDANNRTTRMYLSPDSSYWYKRHFIRDNMIQDLLKDSQYGQRAVATALKGTTIAVGGLVLGTAIIVGGVGLGGAIIYVAAKGGGSSEVFTLGLTVMGGGAYYGGSVISNSFNKAKAVTRKDLDEARIYRFVRFLPEYVWVGWNKQKPDYPITLFRGKNKVLPLKKTDTKTRVKFISIGFFPDSGYTRKSRLQIKN